MKKRKTILVCLLSILVILIFFNIFNKKELNNNKIEVSLNKKEVNEKGVFPGNHLSFFDYQKPILKFPVRKADGWIQGASVNQIDNDIYIARQPNRGTTLTIERINIITGKKKDSRKVSIQSGTYAEGLPWFRNNKGELCFLVRQVPTDQISIFNYSKNRIEGKVDLLGSYKIGFDINQKYIVTCNATKNVLDKIYVYDFDSVVKGSPKLLKIIKTKSEDLLFEKPQGITIHDNKIIFSHGGKDGNPAISVVNFEGKVENVFYYDRKSYAEMINETYPNFILDKKNYRYENEGVFMYNYKGEVYPALVQILNHTTTIIVLSGAPDGQQVKIK
ncbi:hypothetical protein [Neobacillus vireti]|uniref:Lipoprotein n=1 Tax=Neobacillus vireti LMG 21834 TaxID=1131730 RepID=A0AB94IQ06_9BACI|nr:hypothetical protein [Neobacillus vireti]ETI69169.1 hypothetical protein BAVI_08721 [Neobacillus vireti LMG 21834]KLT15546.1 hypothetical protein AA980_23165 [Neobacillus vireti]